MLQQGADRDLLQEDIIRREDITNKENFQTRAAAFLEYRPPSPVGDGQNTAGLPTKQHTDPFGPERETITQRE